MKKYTLRKVKIGNITLYDLNTESVGRLFKTEKEAKDYLKRFGYLKGRKK